MQKKFATALLITLLLSTNCIPAFGWGVWGHNHINKGAVMALPAEMGMFFYNHVDFMVEESVIPDIRKHTLSDRAENPRHYIDLEKYNYTTPANMPRTMADAITKFSKDSLDRHGILPWYIQDMMTKLTAAFKNKRKTEILFLAADLGHYIADGHMPLHTSVNHNGQLTGQEGIHAFWEAQLPEIFGKKYNLCTGEAKYEKDIEKTTWNFLDSSHNLTDKLLSLEYKMKKDNPLEKQYILGNDGLPQKNKYGQPVHTYEYAHVYHELLGGMVESQMRAALKITADFWYTAWVNAGKPDLSDLDPEYVTSRNKQFYKEDMKYWKAGKIHGCKSDKEF